jgi:hypothetical protein
MMSRDFTLPKQVMFDTGCCHASYPFTPLF